MPSKFVIAAPLYLTPDGLVSTLLILVKGDRIQISGIGKPYTTVHAIMTSSSGKTYDTAVSTGLDGSYALSYSTSSSYETGNWYITLTNQFMARVISIFLEPTG